MWADFMVQKFFNVEKLQMRHYRQKKNVKNGAYAIFQHRITFEPLIQFS